MQIVCCCSGVDVASYIELSAFERFACCGSRIYIFCLSAFGRRWRVKRRAHIQSVLAQRTMIYDNGWSRRAEIAKWNIVDRMRDFCALLWRAEHIYVFNLFICIYTKAHLSTPPYPPHVPSPTASIKHSSIGTHRAQSARMFVMQSTHFSADNIYQISPNTTSHLVCMRRLYCNSLWSGLFSQVDARAVRKVSGSTAL